MASSRITAVNPPKLMKSLLRLVSVAFALSFGAFAFAGDKKADSCKDCKECKECGKDAASCCSAEKKADKKAEKHEEKKADKKPHGN